MIRLLRKLFRCNPTSRLAIAKAQAFEAGVQKERAKQAKAVEQSYETGYWVGYNEGYNLGFRDAKRVFGGGDNAGGL